MFPGAGRYDWASAGRPEQQAPPGDWTTWLFLGGRGAGKTRAGAEWIRARAAGFDPAAAVRSDAPPCIALVAETYADAREVMIEGPSGLRAVEPRATRPKYEAARRRLVWPNGVVAYCFSAEDPDGLRGYQFSAAWGDELCKWRYPEETWSNLQLALRLGERPRQVMTTTPRPTKLVKRLVGAGASAVTRATSYDNRANLSAAFFSEIVASYAGTALGRQELLGEIVDDVPGALWTWNAVEAARVAAAPPLARVVVAVDPPASLGPDADECGVVVAGVVDIDAAEPTAFVLADYSVQGLSPRGWADRVIAAFHDYAADRIVVEVNQGGEMARAVIAQADPNAPVRTVRATRGKRLRAEPVAALYERGRVRHVGAFPELESQMTSFTGAADPSPDRLDALVWALTDLLLVRPNGAPRLRRLS
ncbi:MAG: terminase family protein [Pseudomonadota bacterium]